MGETEITIIPKGIHANEHEVGGIDEVVLTGLVDSATKEFFVPIFGGTDVSQHGALIDLAAEFAFMQLLVLQDFTAITDLEVIFRPLETGADMHILVQTWYGAYNGGEAYGVHTETEAARDIGATVTDENLAHSIADLVDVAALAAGDRLQIFINYNATVIDTNVYVIGVRLRYT